jgi:SAM-dependent methyltransferase
MSFAIRHPDEVPDPRAEAMLPAIGGFPSSDKPLFLAGYSELCRGFPEKGRAIEICGGSGKLAIAFAKTFPQASVTGIDLYAASGPEIDEVLRGCPGLSFEAGDAFDLSPVEAGSVDLVFGQAALHHLSHDLAGLCSGVLRVLKPGGRLVFIFEPLGNNPLVAAIRAARMARHELGDESNLYISQFRAMMGSGFSSCEVQVFNFLGYPAKALADRCAPAASLLQRIDSRLFRCFPGMMRLAANCNLVLTK